MILLDGAPKALNPGVVRSPSFSIHGYFYALFFHKIAPGEGGVLRPLVRIDDFWKPVAINGIFHYFKAPRSFQRIANAPGKDFSAVHVHYSCQVQKSSAHRDVGDVGAPDLIGACNLHSSKQIGFDVLGQSQFG